MPDKPCGKTVLAKAGAPRMCHLQAGHDGPHEVIYRQRKVSIPR